MQQVDIRTERLSVDDRATLSTRRKGYFIFIVPLAAITYAFFNMVPLDTVAISILGVFFLFFYGVIGFLIYTVSADLSSDQKQIIKGFVDEKHTRIPRKTSQFKRSLIIGGKGYVVDFATYVEAKAGDLVEIHYAPKSDIAFKVINLSSADKAIRTTGELRMPSIQKPTKDLDKYKNLEPLSVIMQPGDQRVLRKNLWQWMRFRLLALGFFAYIMLGLSLSGLYAVLLFLFPIPIVFLIILYVILKKTYVVSRDINRSTKLTVKALITDKHSTTRRARTHYTFNTTYGSVIVSKSLYDELASGDEIEIHWAPKSKIVLGVQDKKGHYVPNS
ncbi:MAG: hypothetical protein KDC92_00280 [Bacteroidetes bacterium]|nr:hypothetical protein [Bacteroidota bacterium]